MIHDLNQLRSVIAEIADWDLEQRRAYLKNVATAFGVEAERQIKNALIEFWAKRKNVNSGKEIA